MPLFFIAAILRAFRTRSAKRAANTRMTSQQQARERQRRREEQSARAIQAQRRREAEARRAQEELEEVLGYCAQLERVVAFLRRAKGQVGSKIGGSRSDLIAQFYSSEFQSVNVGGVAALERIVGGAAAFAGNAENASDRADAKLVAAMQNINRGLTHNLVYGSGGRGDAHIWYQVFGNSFLGIDQYNQRTEMVDAYIDLTIGWWHDYIDGLSEEIEAVIQALCDDL